MAYVKKTDLFERNCKSMEQAVPIAWRNAASFTPKTEGREKNQN
jgi:hypothetical protein